MAAPVWAMAAALGVLALSVLVAALEAVRSLRHFRTASQADRRAEVAEDTLVKFYAMREIFWDVRTGHTSPAADFTDLLTRMATGFTHRDRQKEALGFVCAMRDRLNGQRSAIAAFRVTRHRAVALFGERIGREFDAVEAALGDLQDGIEAAFNALGPKPQEAFAAMDADTIVERLVGRREDPMDKALADIVERVDAVTRPVLERQGR